MFDDTTSVADSRTSPKQDTHFDKLDLWGNQSEVSSISKPKLVMMKEAPSRNSRPSKRETISLPKKPKIELPKRFAPPPSFKKPGLVPNTKQFMTKKTEPPPKPQKWEDLASEEITNIKRFEEERRHFEELKRTMDILEENKAIPSVESACETMVSLKELFSDIHLRIISLTASQLACMNDILILEDPAVLCRLEDLGIYTNT